MEYLIETYGLPKIAHLINELKGQNSFEHAFQNVYEIDLFEAELNWYNYIEKKYRWSFLLDFDTYLWIFILILFTLVFVAIKLRNRKTIKNWEEEERLANS